MKRILMLIDSLGSGGAQRQFVYLARGLKSVGHDVHVGYYHNEGFYSESLNGAAVPHGLIDAKSPVQRVVAVRRWLRRSKADVVIAFLHGPSLFAEIAGLPHRRFRLIVSERNTSREPLSFYERVRLQFHRLADVVVSNSYSQAAVLGRSGLARKTQVIVNTVDFDRFFPEPVERSPSGTLKLISVGRYEPQKNAAIFVGYCQSRASSSDVRIDWYGNNESEAGKAFHSELEQMVQKYGLKNALFFHGAEKNVSDRYRSADALCLPSFWEGTPNVVCEAMACGLPILCSSVCDNPLIVQDGVNGFLFDPNSVSSLASAIEKLRALGPEMRAAMRRANIERAACLFSPITFLSRWNVVINDDQNV